MNLFSTTRKNQSLKFSESSADHLTSNSKQSYYDSHSERPLPITPNNIINNTINNVPNQNPPPRRMYHLFSSYNSLSADFDIDDDLDDMLDGNNDLDLNSNRFSPLPSTRSDYNLEQYSESGLDSGSKNNGQKRWSLIPNTRQFSLLDIYKICRFKCIISTFMLIFFIILAIAFMRFVSAESIAVPLTYDFIIIGGGPAGSMLCKLLLKQGAKVLLLEAGKSSSNPQKIVFGVENSDLSIFNIPLLWSSVSFLNKDHQWHDSNNNSIYDIHLNYDNNKNNNIYISTLSSKMLMLGKGFGGSSLFSPMIYLRAIPSDIIQWGIKGWTWNKLLNHYKSNEIFHNDTFLNNNNNNNNNNNISDYHNSFNNSGSIWTTMINIKDDLSVQFVKLMTKYNILNFTSDFNDYFHNREQTIGYYHVNIHHGLKSIIQLNDLYKIGNENNDNNNYYNINKNNNFVAEFNAKVTRIILCDKKSNPKNSVDYNDCKRELKVSVSKSITNEMTAIGVEYIQDGIIKKAYLSKPHVGIKMKSKHYFLQNIIITAGAVMTPKLLMLSGIGSYNELNSNRIEPKIINENVGMYLQDHPMIGLTYKINKNSNCDQRLSESYNIPSFLSLSNEWTAYLHKIQSLQHCCDDNNHNNDDDGDQIQCDEEDVGIMGSIGHSVGMFIKSPFTHHESPDIQITFYPTISEPHIINHFQEKYKQSKEKMNFDNQVLFTIALMYPEATYQVSLNKSDPIESMPIVHLPSTSKTYLSEKDVNVLLWGIQQVRIFAKLLNYENYIQEEVSPGDYFAAYEYFQLTQWIHDNVVPSTNWAGSCRMGFTSTDSVVDNYLRVRGVDSLMIA
eukprot:gene12992-17421_t